MKLNVNATTYIPKNKLTGQKTSETTTTEPPKTIQQPTQKTNIPPNTQNYMINPQMMMMSNPAFYNRKINFN